MPHPLEVHLQTGFTGQTVLVDLDGRRLAEVEARTPLQLGLAHRLTVQADVGQTLTISVPARSLVHRYTIGAGDEVVTVNLDDAGLLVEPARERPVYF
ncbi:MAG: hypothetical protein DI564_16785 [Rhodanobacter denitrificans]|uniref:Uncharacterized protein n=1 Tax=Rhodanobacter denitrificans TaxID=666685 RepID=A0A2W5K3N2_9GAMM|nr:MAG: hypothetical protein DI564_16785 [Rhodanobacter denitrificans]